MQIECPFCHTQVRFPDEKEGSKVRCPQCSKIYVAHERGRGRDQTNPAPIVIGVGAALVIGVFLFIIMNRKPPAVAEARPVEVVEPERAPALDTDGWDSAPVLAVRALYEAVRAGDLDRIVRSLHGERLVAFQHEQALVEQPDAPAPAPFASLDPAAQGELLSGVARDLMGTEDENAPALWEPHDGRLEETDGEVALVHLYVSRTMEDQKLVSRTMAWHLVRVEERGEKVWKIFGWERYLSPEEAAALRRNRAKKYEKVTLSDGSVMYQAEPQPIPHLDDTPPELRQRIDETFARMLNFELRGPENSRAMRELIEIGRPALPALLTGLFEIKITDDESKSKINLIDQALCGITGETMGYKPDPSLGTSEERRGAAVKGWFAWWWRKGELRFEERKEGVDLLEQLIVPTERDKREMEKDAKTGG
jgi:predicted Zn finger-like uncharacterized protein